MIVAFAALVVTSCSKDQNLPESFVLATVEEVVSKANQKYFVADVFGGEENLSFFIPNEGLIDEYLTIDNLSSGLGKALNNGFIGCLRALELSEAQLTLIRRSLIAYENRNQAIIAKHRQEVAMILDRAEAKRKELRKQLLDGEITQAEFDRRIALLRTRLQAELLRLKESNASHFSRSYRLLLNQLKGILSATQWSAFTICLQ